jgi:hypothetical protein
MILEKKDAIYAANFFIDYFSNIERIDDYFRRIKIDRMRSFPTALPGMGMRDYFFSDFGVHPSEMSFSIREDDVLFDDLLDLTASHVVERNVPGRTIKLTIYEKTTQSIIGFIRLGSCAINSRPRNVWLGQPLNTTDLRLMKHFNQCSVMGQIIVPSQPFGFNYLGGKLLAGLCCSHEIRELFDGKYNASLCHFETTSLYGSTKGVSQYDGMKPMLRYKGQTTSDFAPLMVHESFKEMKELFKNANDGKDLVDRYSKSNLDSPKSSLKKSIQIMMISIIKSSLKEHHEADVLSLFSKTMASVKDMNEQKRVYISSYGFANAADFILGKTDQLTKDISFDRHYQENVISWWKKIASKRYEKLSAEGRVRKELELWNENTDIDIIR